MKSWLPRLTTRNRNLESKSASRSFWATNGALWFQKFLAESTETEDANCDSWPIVCSLIVSKIIHKNAVCCSESFGKSHTIYAYLTRNDVKRFRNQTVRQSCCLKATPPGSKTHEKFWDPKPTGFLILSTTVVQDILFVALLLGLAYTCDK